MEQITELEHNWHLFWNEFANVTGLVCDDEIYYILNGNHEEEYKKLYQRGGIESCIEYYHQNQNLKSCWASDYDWSKEVKNPVLGDVITKRKYEG